MQVELRYLSHHPRQGFVGALIWTISAVASKLLANSVPRGIYYPIRAIPFTLVPWFMLRTLRSKAHNYEELARAERRDLIFVNTVTFMRDLKVTTFQMKECLKNPNRRQFKKRLGKKWTNLRKISLRIIDLFKDGKNDLALAALGIPDSEIKQRAILKEALEYPSRLPFLTPPFPTRIVYKGQEAIGLTHQQIEFYVEAQPLYNKIKELTQKIECISKMQKNHINETEKKNETLYTIKSTLCNNKNKPDTLKRELYQLRKHLLLYTEHLRLWNDSVPSHSIGYGPWCNAVEKLEEEIQGIENKHQIHNPEVKGMISNIKNTFYQTNCPTTKEKATNLAEQLSCKLLGTTGPLSLLTPDCAKNSRQVRIFNTSESLSLRSTGLKKHRPLLYDLRNQVNKLLQGLGAKERQHHKYQPWFNTVDNLEKKIQEVCKKYKKKSPKEREMIFNIKAAFYRAPWPATEKEAINLAEQLSCKLLDRDNFLSFSRIQRKALSTDEQAPRTQLLCALRNATKKSLEDLGAEPRRAKYEPWHTAVEKFKQDAMKIKIYNTPPKSKLRKCVLLTIFDKIDQQPCPNTKKKAAVRAEQLSCKLLNDPKLLSYSYIISIQHKGHRKLLCELRKQANKFLTGLGARKRQTILNYNPLFPPPIEDDQHVPLEDFKKFKKQFSRSCNSMQCEISTLNNIMKSINTAWVLENAKAEKVPVTGSTFDKIGQS